MRDLLMRDFTSFLTEERYRQDEKWGMQDHEGHAWIGILTEEVGELAKAINENDDDSIETELIQVAAVCCAMYERHMSTPLKPQFKDREGK
jgi:NTP pyrophosphatase (non-canonical NTP hydrolase)